MGILSKGGSSKPDAPEVADTTAQATQVNRLNTYDSDGGGQRYGYTNKKGKFKEGAAPAGSGYQSAVQQVQGKTSKKVSKKLQGASKDIVKQLLRDNVKKMPKRARVGDRGDIADQIFDRTFSLMSPAIEKTNSRLLNNLQARGMPVGGEGFNEAYGDQQTRTQDTISRLAMDADINAGQEQSRQFSLDQAERSGALSELIALFGGGYTAPTSVANPQAIPVDVGGAVAQQYQTEMDQYNASQGNKTSLAGTVGGLGGAAMLAKSSMTYKEIDGFLDIPAASQAVQNMQVMNWRYLPEHRPEGDTPGARHVGPMAEQFYAETGLGDGRTIPHVDYFGLLTAALKDALNRIELLERESDRGE